jgi:hypothetical protein
LLQYPEVKTAQKVALSAFRVKTRAEKLCNFYFDSPFEKVCNADALCSQIK